MNRFKKQYHFDISYESITNSHFQRVHELEVVKSKQGWMTSEEMKVTEGIRPTEGMRLGQNKALTQIKNQNKALTQIKNLKKVDHIWREQLD